MEALEASHTYWSPDPEASRHTRMASLMRRLGATDYPDLVRIGAEETDRFWKAAVEDIGIEWYEPYSAVSDSSRGMEWTTWFTGGKMNLVHNCVDKHVQAGKGDNN